MVKKLVAESLNESNDFKRGLKGKELRDTVTDNFMTLTIDANSLYLDQNGNPDLSDPDSAELISELDKSGINYSIGSRNYNRGAVPITFTGTKEQFIEILTMWDPHAREADELAEVLKDWNKDNIDDIWEFLDPMY